LSSTSLQVSGAGVPGVQLCSLPPAQRATVVAQAPVPQLTLPWLTFTQLPAIVPVHVEGLGSWQSGSQVVAAEPAAWEGQTLAADSQAPVAQSWEAAETSARR
jgi:hypothetical protein